MDLHDVLLDSAEGIAYLIDWAKAHGVVLNEYHENVAAKYAVPTDGVTFARRIPLV